MNIVLKCWNKECSYFDPDQVDQCSHPTVVRSQCYMAVLKPEGRSKNWYHKELLSNECACGKSKQPRRSFCWHDFKSLPRDLQKALYRRIGHGYEEAYEEAHKYLTENVW
jgi:hypothetical protein